MILLELAGWRFGLDCSAPWLAEALAARYAAFRAQAGWSADFTITIEASVPACTSREREATGVLTAKTTAREQQNLLDMAGICGRINDANWHIWLTLQTRDPIAEAEYVLRLACASFAYRSGGLLIHGAALLRGRGAHVFIGPSGSGKSTVVALSRDHIALNDDLILLRRGDEGWMAYGTPFWNLTAVNRTGQTASGPVAAFYTLIKDTREPSVSDMPQAAGVAALVANCPVVNGQPAELPGLLARCHELAAGIPVRELRFRKDAGFWDAIRDYAAQPAGQSTG